MLSGIRFRRAKPTRVLGTHGVRREAYLNFAALARETRSNRTPVAEFFVQLQTLTGQTDDGRMPTPLRPSFLESKPSDLESIRKYELRSVGWRVLNMRQHLGDEPAIARIEAWADAPVPKFYKL